MFNHNNIFNTQWMNNWISLNIKWWLVFAKFVRRFSVFAYFEHYFITIHSLFEFSRSLSHSINNNFTRYFIKFFLGYLSRFQIFTIYNINTYGSWLVITVIIIVSLRTLIISTIHKYINLYRVIYMYEWFINKNNEKTHQKTGAP